MVMIAPPLSQDAVAVTEPQLDRVPGVAVGFSHLLKRVAIGALEAATAAGRRDWR